MTPTRAYAIAVATLLAAAPRLGHADPQCTYTGSYYSPENWNYACLAETTVPLGCPIYLVAPHGVVDVTATSTVIGRAYQPVTLASKTVLDDTVTEQMHTVDVYSCDCARETLAIQFDRLALSLTDAHEGDMVSVGASYGNPSQNMVNIEAAGPCPPPVWPSFFEQATACDRCPGYDSSPSQNAGGCATAGGLGGLPVVMLVAGLLVARRRLLPSRTRYTGAVKKASPVIAVWAYAEFGAVLAAFLPVMAISSLRHRGDPTQRVPGQWIRRVGRTAARLSTLWKFDIEGERPPDIDTAAYVVIANHESQADPFLLSFLPWDMRWVAKESLFKQPLSGWALRLSGDIPLRRGEGDSVRACLLECERAIRGGISVMMFPEGTRSDAGDLLPFKDGAFDLAIRAGVPILPIALAGTRAMRPKHSRWFGKAHACAKILPPIGTAGLTAADIGSLRDQARAAIAAALPELRSRYAVTAG
jgi:1-acyl-sn-glycerol-3-phosphate acyltransferase